jgi:VCBS repeat-containing protein
MHPPKSVSLVLISAVVFPSLVCALPTAVDDTFNTQEDVAAGNAAVNLVNSTFDPPASTFVMPANWDYFDAMKTVAAGGTNQYPVDDESHNWKALNFNKATSTIGAWKSAPMPIQGGGVDGLPGAANLLTGITGNNQNNTVNSYLFRNKFTMTPEQANVAPNWAVSVLADDGCIIYLNGAIAGRVNYPDNVAIEPDAVTGGQGGSETAYSTILIPSSAFLDGENILAVELHQNSANSSDAGIDLKLAPSATEGFTPVTANFFASGNEGFSAPSHSSNTGRNTTGALRVQMGNVFNFGGGGTAVSGGWRKTFNLAAPATVTLSFWSRLMSGADYDAGEYQEVLCDVDGTQFGEAHPPTSQHLSVQYQVGNGNGGGIIDSGWKQSTFNIPLAAGSHTLTLGGYGNAGSAGFGGTVEAFEATFDDVLLTVPGSVSLLANDTGATGLTAVKASDPAHGTVTVNSDGSFNYVPAANYFGTDTFTYRAVDGTGQSNPATVTINIASVNDLPVGGADTYTTGQGVPLTVNAAQGVLVNDSDVESPAASLTAALGTTAPNGTLKLNADGSFTYTPTGLFAGADTFTYRINDGTGLSNPVTVTINVTDSPDPPTAATDTYTAVKNTPLVVTATTAGNTTDEVLPYKSADWHYFDSMVLANRDLGTAWRTEAFVENADWKVGAAELGYGNGDEATQINDNPVAAFDPQAGDKFMGYYFRRNLDIANRFNVIGVEIQMLYDDGGVLYINGTEAGRTNNMTGAPVDVPFNYQVEGNINNNSTQTFTLPPTVFEEGTNLLAVQMHQNAPTSSDISFDLRIRLTRAAAASVLANDTDPDPGQTATLTAQAVTQPAHGSLTLNPNGTFTYTPANGYTGPDSFTYQAKDSTNQLSGVATANITVVTGPNVPPIANADTYAATEDTLLTVNRGAGLLANDTDAEEDPFTAVVATQPSHGTLTLNANGSFTYQPAANYNGPDSFTYRATDARGSIPATVTINVAAVNDLPVSANDTYAGDPGQALTVAAAQGVLANDSDVDAGTVLTAEVVTPPASGTLTLNTDGSFTFSAPTGGVYTFTYRAKDLTSQSSPATVTISLNAVPVTAADAYTTPEDTAINRSAAQGVLSNDSDPESQTLTAELVTNVQHGTLTLNGNGSFDYNPSSNFFGADSFTYRAFDGTRRSNPVTVSLSITAVNDAPVSVADTYGVRIDTPFAVTAANGVLRNDTDVDNPVLTVALVTDVQDGTLVLNPDGSFSYTPVTGFSGARTFSYRASDGTLQSTATTVTLNVTANLNTVAITELMYNPPGTNGAKEEFIEIFNYGDAAVDLSGWRFTKGVNYTFPAGTLLAGKAYLAIPADRAALEAKYPAAGNIAPGWGANAGSLSNSGENVRLLNAEDEIVAEVEYADQGDWAARKIENVWRASNTPGAAPPPVGNLQTDPGLEWSTPADPDPELGNAGGSSLQLRNISLPHNAGQNWAAAAPTPGAANTAVAQTNSAPLISKVKHSPAVPDHTQQVFVTAKITDEQVSGFTASVFYRTWLPSGTAPETVDFTEVVMADSGQRGDGAAGDGEFGAVIPAQALNRVVEFYVRATDAASNSRTWPAPTLNLTGENPQQNANCLYQVNEEPWTDSRPLYMLVMTGADNASFNAGLSSRQSNVSPNCTVIFRQGNDYDIRYLGGIRPRGNSSRNDTPINLRMDIPKDNPWNGRTAFTLNVKHVFSQYLASRLYEAAGLPCEVAGVVGMRINGENRVLDGNNDVRTFGLYCDLIPRGGDVIKRWFPDDDDGNGYGKIRAGFGGSAWGTSTLPTIGAGGYAVGGYINLGWTKQTNAPQNDWTDLDAWLQDMNTTASIASYHTAVADTLDIDEWARHFALSAIINHSETNITNGDDDDYSLYFPAKDRRARIIPHDLDTCFNLRGLANALGDETADAGGTIYQATGNPWPANDGATADQMDKFYKNPVTGRKFKAALRDLLDTVFAKPRFDATVDQLLDSGWMGDQYTPTGSQIRTYIKAFLDQRRTKIETYLPTAFTAATSLPVQDGLPRATSATDSGLGGKIDPARTAAVTVNGVSVSTNPYGPADSGPAASDNSWSAGTAVVLKPGLNTLVCSAFDEKGGLLASQTVTIWYDAAGTDKSGTLAASETWTAAGGPYNVTSTLSVPSGVTLTIEPGATVFMASNADLNVSGGGRLVAQGTAAAGITFARKPSQTGNWGNITVNGASAEPTILSYVIFDNNGDVAFHSQGGANVELDHLTFRNTAEGYLSLDGSSFIVRDCVFPNSTAGFEPVHGSGGIAAGGRGIIRDCWFGKTQGYNDSIDFTGGNRPGPILQVINCVFNGSDDDILDLDSTDAWVEGNIFMHAHRNGSPDSASAISGGSDNADFSQVTVIRNLFYDCDNVITMKQGNQPNGASAALLYNTIAHITKTGGEDTASGVVNFDDADVNGEGKGMYLEGNIIHDVENLTRNYDPALSLLTLVNNILPSAPPATATGNGNTVGDPMLRLSLITTPGTATATQVIAALTPENCSPALSTGGLGQDRGAGSRAPGITVKTPPGQVWPSGVVLPVGPAGSFTPVSQAAWTYGYTEYKYSVDTGAQSAETPVATPITLSGLTNGPHKLSVWGRNDAGWYQDEPTVIDFVVHSGVPSVVLSEVLADSATAPDMVELYNWGTAPASLNGSSLSDESESPRKYVFSGTAPLAAGARIMLDATQLGFSLNKGGETVTLHAQDGTVIDSVTFGPQVTGLSVARIGSVWQLSTPTPGAANTAACQLGSTATLRINEWLGANDFIVAGDFVELYNPEANPVSISGWSLTQDFRNEPAQNVFPPLSFVAGAGFLELKADGDTAAGPDHLSFKVSSLHDTITFLNPAGAVSDNVLVLPGLPDASQGRSPDGASTVTYLPLPTPGFSNGTNLTTDTEVMNALRITEFRFDPPSNSQAEYIELKNISGAPVTLTGVHFGSGITCTFPASTLAAGAYTVITSDLTAFHNQFPAVPAIQWTSGRLDNNGESIRLETVNHNLGILDFRYEGDWYPETRAGAALEIVNPSAPRGTWGLRESWQPAAPSPGTDSAFGVIAPLGFTVASGSPATLHAYVFPGALPIGNVTVQWTKVSGPGNVTFTAPANKDTDANFTASGTYELRITASGPGGNPTAADTVTISVAETYAAWAARTMATLTPAQQAATADPDRDGNVNLVEHVMGTDPTARTAGPVIDTSNGRLSLNYTRSKLADPAIQIIPQISDDAGTWHEGPSYVVEEVTGSSATSQTILASDAFPIAPGARRYLRLKVTQ